MSKVLITGTTSGIGLALKNVYINNGYQVDSINRELVDLEDLDMVSSFVERFIGDSKYKYVFLNAGVLGKLADSTKLPVDNYQSVFNINVWSNKIIIDSLINKKAAENIICISSGASTKAYFGWSLYCSSKAAMKQLMSCYSLEHPDIRFLSLAPGIIKTKMQDTIYSYDELDIPSVKKFKDMYHDMETPEECSYSIFKNIDKILDRIDVDFFDLRNIK